MDAIQPSPLRPLVRIDGLAPKRVEYSTACGRFILRRQPDGWHIISNVFRDPRLHHWLNDHNLTGSHRRRTDALAVLEAHLTVDPPQTPPTPQLTWKRVGTCTHHSACGRFTIRTTPDRSLVSVCTIHDHTTGGLLFAFTIRRAKQMASALTRT